MAALYAWKNTVVKSTDRKRLRSRKSTDDFSVPAMTFDPAQRRRALSRFLKDNHLTLHQITVAAGLAEGTTRGFMRGGTRSLRDETYEQLAAAASEILGRPVTAGELRGEAPPLVVKVESVISAGAEVRPIEDDASDWVEAPPSRGPLTAAIVKGESGLPMFEDGDVLFCGEPTRAVARYKGKVVVVRLRDGRSVIRRLQPGHRSTTWHLHSINQALPTIENAGVENIAVIAWVKRSV